jgi:hypothetical protein
LIWPCLKFLQCCLVLLDVLAGVWPEEFHKHMLYGPFECQVVGEHPAGDHRLVLGKAVNGKLLDSQAEPRPIAKPAQWTAPPRCFPTCSAIHDAAHGNRVSPRQWRVIRSKAEKLTG